MKKLPSTVEYFRKSAEIFITAMAAQMAPKVESHAIKIKVFYVIQEWVFRLGPYAASLWGNI